MDPQNSTPNGKFNYAEALQKSFLFYEAQRAGDLPEDNRIPWRGDSVLEDGNDVGRNLSGGYFDAGDHVKFGLPMAASITMLAWGVDEYKNAYAKISQLDESLDAIKWGTDYILAAYDDKGTTAIADDVFYGQVGNGHADHAYWGPAETLSMDRPTYQIDAANPGSDLAGEAAAALASASIIFRAQDAAYADKLLTQAKQLYAFAEAYRGKYSDSITDATSFYNSWSGYTDELAWGATWLHKATKAAGETNSDYLAKAENYFNETGGIAAAPWTQNWDDKKYGTAILLAQETVNPQYQAQVESWLDRWMVDRQNGGIPEYTDGGLAWLDQWGSTRYAANTAMLAGIYADTVNDKNGQYSEFVQSQINYLLGDNPNNQSYVVGFGENSPQNPHHRGAHGSTNNNIHEGETKNVLYGALVGGPSRPDDDAWVDERDDFIANEVALDYNAGFTGALAYMVDKHDGTPLADSEIPKLFDEKASPAPNPAPEPTPAPTPEPTPSPSPQPDDPGSESVLLGTNGQDTLQGKANNEVIKGLGGNDKIFAQAGNDTIYGGAGNDEIYGGADNDKVYGGGGNDKIYGGEGNDVLQGNSTWQGRSGKNEQDELMGAGGADTFVLGNNRTVFYRDGKNNTLGKSDYALIKDFNQAQGDVIQLNGNASKYRLGNSPIGSGKGIFLKVPGQDELIGIVRGQLSNLNLDSNAFQYVGDRNNPTPSPSPTPETTPEPTPAPMPESPSPSTSQDGGIEFEISTDWGSGHQAQVKITNEGGNQISGWTLEFEYASNITQIWNAEIVSHTGNTYVIRDAGYNSEIAPDASISFGFL
ncbi:MAG: glycoside hydrolase family 9 protein, partial [Cyanobacteria bacterium P01_F01_bin.86]